MPTVSFHFHGELNDFLPARRQRQQFAYAVTEKQSIKDVIESIGVPHPEVALIVMNNTPVDFGYLVQDNDQFDVYPAYSPTVALPFPRVLPAPAPRFILDVHLGRLAEYLRLLGFDTLYRNDYDDPELAAVAGDEQRILLTRDLGLLKRNRVIYGAYVRATDPQQQVIEILRRFNFWQMMQPFQRCSRCNGRLRTVAKTDIEHELPPQTREEHDEYRQCEQCKQLYWEGSHFTRLRLFIEQIRAAQQHET
jgi:uncharacterized protein with PIN domain